MSAAAPRSGPVNRRRCAGLLLATATLGGSVSTPSGVSHAADTKQECSDAYYGTQVLRDEGKLEEALVAVKLCVRDSCAPFIRDDCTNWQRDLETRLEALAASVVVLAVDASGAPLREVAVTLDGKPWLERLDGIPRSVRAGTYKFEGRVLGAPPQTTSVVLREGEKNRQVKLSFDVEGPEFRGGGAGPGPWILGGAGVAALVAGAITGGFVVDAYETMKDVCDDANGTCPQAGIDAQERGRELGPWTTGLLVGGGTLVAGAAVWLIVIATRPAAPTTTSFLLAPSFSPNGAGLLLYGSF